MDRDLEPVVRKRWNVIERFLRLATGEAPWAREAIDVDLFVAFLGQSGHARIERKFGRPRNYVFEVTRLYLAERLGELAPEPERRDLASKLEGVALHSEFNRGWFLGLINHGRRLVKDRFLGGEDRASYRIFRLFYFGEGTGGGSLPPEAIAEAVGSGLDEVKRGIRESRSVFLECLRREITEYCADPREVEVEMRDIAQFVDRNQADQLGMLSTIFQAAPSSPSE